MCFLVLIAQETDWMDKLEKQLRRSPKMAADAEEISEELDVRNFNVCTNKEMIRRHSFHSYFGAAPLNFCYERIRLSRMYREC